MPLCCLAQAEAEKTQSGHHVPEHARVNYVSNGGAEAERDARPAQAGRRREPGQGRIAAPTGPQQVHSAVSAAASVPESAQTWTSLPAG